MASSGLLHGIHWVGRAPVGPRGRDTSCLRRSCGGPATVIHGIQQAQSLKGVLLAPSHALISDSDAH